MLPQVGTIAKHLAEAQYTSISISSRCQYSSCPEAGTVKPAHPPVVLGGSLRSRDSQLIVRDTRALILGREKDRERTANGLPLIEPEDELGAAAIPGYN